MFSSPSEGKLINSRGAFRSQVQAQLMGSLFKPKEQVRCSHILVESQGEAEALLRRLQEGCDFAGEAAKLSKCPSGQNGGDLGKFSRGKMVKEFDKVAFDLEIGQLSGLVKTQFGYHILKRTE